MKPVVCFTGDQGFQMNIQELQAIAHDKLPILIVVMNNSASGMIRDKEKKSFGTYLHSTLDSGYSIPELSKIADAYGIIFEQRAWCFVGKGGNITCARCFSVLLICFFNS